MASTTADRSFISVPVIHLVACIANVCIDLYDGQFQFCARAPAGVKLASLCRRVIDPLWSSQINS